jgi:hypothetical protein
VTHATTPALNTDNAVALLDNTKFDTVVDTPLETSVNVFLPDLDIEVGLCLGEIEGIDAPIQVRIPGCGVVTSDHDNGTDGTVLGHEASGFTTTHILADDDIGQKKGPHVPCGQYNNGTSVQFQASTDGRHGNCLNCISRARTKSSELVENAEVRNRHLSDQTGVVHHGNGLGWVVTLGSLTRQHDTVSTVKNGVGNVRYFSTGGARVVCHGLQHLSSTNDRLAFQVALGDHHLLSEEDLGGRDFDTKITTSNHDTIGFLENLIEVVYTLLVLDLGNDLNFATLFAEDLSDFFDVFTPANKRSENHIDLVLDTKTQVVLVLLREGGEIDIGARQVDTLAGRDITVVEAFYANGLVINDVEDFERENTVINIDELARRDHLADVLVIKEPAKAILSATKNLFPFNVQRIGAV